MDTSESYCIKAEKYEIKKNIFIFRCESNQKTLQKKLLTIQFKVSMIKRFLSDRFRWNTFFYLARSCFSFSGRQQSENDATNSKWQKCNFSDWSSWLFIFMFQRHFSRDHCNAVLGALRYNIYIRGKEHSNGCHVFFRSFPLLSSLAVHTCDMLVSLICVFVISPKN